MFGKNEITKKSTSFDGSYPIREIFSTIQGEGPFTGLPATFIRFGGCNLKCYFCDTDFDSSQSPKATLDHIVSDCVARGNHLVVLTGGEPFLYPIEHLVIALLYLKFEVQVETAGTLPSYEYNLYRKEDFPSYQTVSTVVSPKTGSIHPSIERSARAFKYIVKEGLMDEHDGLPLFNTQEEGGKAIRLARPPQGFPRDQIYLQPMDENHISHADTKRNLHEAIRLCMKFGYRLSVQVHKIVGLP